MNDKFMISALRINAEKLETALKNISADLLSNDMEDWNVVCSKYLVILQPLVKIYSNALHLECSRQLSSEVISEITPIIREISNLESKGEIKFSNSGTDWIEMYHELCTIFRETKFQGQDL